jgi:hypothetical protein
MMSRIHLISGSCSSGLYLIVNSFATGKMVLGLHVFLFLETRAETVVPHHCSSSGLRVVGVGQSMNMKYEVQGWRAAGPTLQELHQLQEVQYVLSSD